MAKIPTTPPKVDLSSFTERERERAPEEPCEPHLAHQPIEKRPSMGPEHPRVSPLHVVEWRPNDGGFLLHSRPSVDRLATSLGIDESLAFRAFDKTIIFGHWLSKTWELSLASKAFLFEKGFYYILVDYL